MKTVMISTKKQHTIYGMRYAIDIVNNSMNSTLAPAVRLGQILIDYWVTEYNYFLLLDR